ncbi:MAG TPA: hypothetical protein VJ939_05725, partial [Bacteroidales bacterium]|nr:hypothetical protein [Bacteroidales bacterium]
MIKIAFGKEYHHELPANHRFPMEKYTLIPEQLMYEGSFTSENFFEPLPIEKSALLAVHDKEYIRKLDNGLLHRKEERRIGFPWSKSLIKREELITSGTLQGALYALEEGVAFNVAGG